MEKICWHQTFSNYKNLEFKPNGKISKFRIKQNLSGNGLRVELSNQFDSVPLKILKLRVSLYSNLKDSVSLTFNNRIQFLIPAESKIWTDKVLFKIAKGQNLYFELEVENELNMLATSANLLSSNIVKSTVREDYTFIYALSSVVIETLNPNTTVIGFFGDSLTNQAYFCDQILKNLYTSQLNISGFNSGISGNRLLLEGTADSQWKDSFGIAGIKRFKEDVILYNPNVVLGLIGINDLFHPGTGSSINELPTSEKMIEGYQSLFNEAAAHNIRYIALTLPPFAQSINHDKPAWSIKKEKIRIKVNNWLREQPNVIDITKFLENKNDSTLLNSKYDSGDHLHFSSYGGEKLGDYITNNLKQLLSIN